MSWGLGGSDSLCVLGVEGSEKNVAPPKDNFWNSPYALAGAKLYKMTPTKYTFLNRSVSGACAGINVPHPSQIYGGVTPTNTEEV